MDYTTTASTTYSNTPRQKLTPNQVITIVAAILLIFLLISLSLGITVAAYAYNNEVQVVSSGITVTTIVFSSVSFVLFLIVAIITRSQIEKSMKVVT